MSEQTRTEIIVEEYQHFRRCGIPHVRTVTLLAEAYETSETAVRKCLYRYREGVSA